MAKINYSGVEFLKKVIHQASMNGYSIEKRDHDRLKVSMDRFPKDKDGSLFEVSDAIWTRVRRLAQLHKIEIPSGCYIQDDNDAIRQDAIAGKKSVSKPIHERRPGL